MRALVVYAHPCPESFNASVRDAAIKSLEGAGHEVRLLDLYAIKFNPVMGMDERRDYHERDKNEAPVAEHIDHVKWAEMLIFIYPTWWFGLPAILKGWLDRVFIPHVTFSLPDGQGPLEGKLTNISKIAIITTCGASFLATKFIGEPGRRTIERGLRHLCMPKCKTLYLAHYKMDTSTDESRRRFLTKVERSLSKY